MDLVFALLAGIAALGFAGELARDHRRRPRPHVRAWWLAMSAYAAATWLLAVGIGVGWIGITFRFFYLLGAIANIPILAAGSVYLVLGDRAGRAFLRGTLGFVALGAVVTLAAPLAPLGDVVVPEGSEVFGFTWEDEGVTLPGPRVFAPIAGAVGTLVIVGLAAYSAIRFVRSRPRLAAGNVLIVAGALAPAFGGTLTALERETGFALSLLAGAVLLWSGYRLATGVRRTAPS